MCARWAWSSSKTTLQKDDDKEAVGTFSRGIIPKTVDDWCGMKMWTVLMTASPCGCLVSRHQTVLSCGFDLLWRHVEWQAMLKGQKTNSKASADSWPRTSLRNTPSTLCACSRCWPRGLFWKQLICFFGAVVDRCFRYQAVTQVQSVPSACLMLNSK